MRNVAIELDLPDGLAQAAEKRGLLSSVALLELIKKEVEKNPLPETPNFNPADYPHGFQPWMAGKVSPKFFRKGKITVSDEEFMKPIEADWYAAKGSWGPGLGDVDDRS